MACGVSVLFIGITGALEGMLEVSGNSVATIHAMLVVMCLALGGLIGEIINIEDRFEKFGEWLKIKTGNAKDKGFVDAFVTALKEGINTNTCYSRFHQRNNNSEEYSPYSATINAGSFIKFIRKIYHKSGTNQNTHSQ